MKPRAVKPRGAVRPKVRRTGVGSDGHGVDVPGTVGHVVGWIVLGLFVLLFGGAFLLDRADRKHGRRQRGSGEMLSNRRDRERNFRSTPEHGVPLMDD